jgi:hypothetical protein
MKRRLNRRRRPLVPAARGRYGEARTGEPAMPATSNHTSVEDLNRANLGKLPEHG